MKADDLFQSVTDKIVAAIENQQTGQWSKPWTSVFGGGISSNYTTKKSYSGFNVLALMMEQEQAGYSSPLWATYRQWQSVDGQVRKGESGTRLVKWGFTDYCNSCDFKGKGACLQHPTDTYRRGWASTFVVFNIDQVDGVDAPVPDLPESEAERLEHIDAFVASLGAEIRYVAGDRAYYRRTQDDITLPLLEQFPTTRGFYSTLLHEVTHWTGAPDRLEREKGTVFGDQKYAAEELVAEIGAAFLMARFGVDHEPHLNTTSYLAGWLKALKSDPRNLYRAAKLAQEAVNWMDEKVAA